MPDAEHFASLLSGLPPFRRDRNGARESRVAPALDPLAVARRLEALGARIWLAADSDYPAGLSALPDPPPALFARGAVPPWQSAVAVVGSRAASRYGLARARCLAADLARLGYTVVSGLARGIDAAAHQGALESGGATVAVLPGGLDAVSPEHHRELAEAVARRGALVTEIASGPPRSGGMFVRRNRLIAALAAATVVVEAAERSGALSTAAVARRIGRPLLAVPGDVDRPTSRGCHALIRSGAGLCEQAADVIRALAGARTPAVAGPRSVEAAILEALSSAPATTDALAERAAVSIEAALPALLRLEWAGLVRPHPGQRWARAPEPGP